MDFFKDNYNSFCRMFPALKNAVFQNAQTTPAPGGPGGPHVPPPPVDGGQTPQEAGQGTRDREQEEISQDLRNELSRSSLGEEVKRRARNALQSEDNAVYKENLVEKLVFGDINPQEFMNQLDALEEQEKSWESITVTQRGIRKNMRELHEKTKSYREIIAPLEEKTRTQERSAFTSSLKSLASLNSSDHSMDSEMKKLLEKAMREAAQGKPGITRAQAEALYLLDPTKPGFDSRFKTLTKKLSGVMDGKFVKHLTDLKREEYRIEKRFEKLFDEVQLIIERNLSRAKREAEKKRSREFASRTVGIHLDPGTVIYAEDPGNLILPPKIRTVRITDVTYDELPMRDHAGKILGYSLGMPRIKLDNGANMTLARFQKWVDSQNAVEKVSNIREVEQKTGFSALGLELKAGQELEYLKITGRDENGELKKEPCKVSIRKIEKDKIHFFSAVQYQTGIGEGDRHIKGVPTESRESLSLGEFLKWYLQNSVFLSMNMEALQKNLHAYNTIYNRQFGISQKDNPPIFAEKGETLYYPDGSGRKFRITDIGDGVIKFDNANEMTFPQFFLWVRNNNVQKEPVAKSAIAPSSAKKPPSDSGKERQLSQQEKDVIAKKESEKAGKLLNGALPESLSPLQVVKNFWFQTSFLSVKDVWNLVVSVKDFVKRKHERRSKGRYAEIGSKLPGVLGTEFERIKQQAENEEVNQYKEAMEQWSIEKVKETLRNTNSKDEAKACIMTLTKKGEMRWDDMHFWGTLNRLTARYTTRGAELYIPQDEAKLKAMKKNGEDMTQPACDALWGDGGWHEWFSQNISAFNNNKKAFEYKGKQLEADPKGTGGLRGELMRLLKTWKHGEYVNPQEYEELIDFAIKYGKMGAEDKMFFLISGVVARNPVTGETLLHMDRPGELDGVYLNAFPLLDFFTDKGSLKPDPPPNGTGMKKRPWTLADYEYWVSTEFPDDYRAGTPGAQFSQFLWRIMVMNENVRTRLSKGLRKAEEMDHDDAHLFIPPATVEEIKQVLGSPTGGQKRNFTPEGYANAYPGFNQFILSLSFGAERAKSEDEKQKLMEAMKESMKSFLVYDSVLSNRLYKDKQDYYARLGEHHFNRTPVVDSSPPKLHQQQLRTLLREVGKAYGMSDAEMYRIVEEKTGSIHNAVEAEKQKKVDVAIEEFLAALDERVKEQGSGKMLEVVKRMRNYQDPKSPSALRGMRGWTLGRSADNPEEFLRLMSGDKKNVQEIPLSELRSGKIQNG